jgi:succinate dehydrogenase / fumarate reductase, cytochrome b subunit
MATTMERRTPPVHRRPPARGPWLVQFYRSAVGKKWVMAVTGLVLMGYVFFHALGNLKLYSGAEGLNHYGEFLRELLVPIFPRTVTLWLMRGGLLLATILHIHSAYSLTRMNARANAGGYEQKVDYQAANIAGRTMRWTGIIITLFVLFHLADLTWGNVNPDFVRGDIYRNMIASFERVPVAILYIVANIALAFHLYHGAWSMFQSLGVNNPKWNSWRKGFAVGFSALILVVNLSFPIAVVTGLVDADDEEACVVEGDRIVSCTGYETEEAAP